LDKYLTVEQRITAGSNWNGVAPSTIPAIADGVKAYPTDTIGGLFDFGFGAEFDLWEVQRIAVDFNGVATKGIYIRKSGAPDIPVYTSTLGTEVKVLITDKIILAADETLVITSVGAATAMYARVTARPLVARV